MDRITMKILGGLLICLLGSLTAWAGGGVSGQVRFQGIFPLPKKLPISVDAETCGIEAVSEDLIVGKKGEIRDAVVFLRGPVEGARRVAVPPGGYLLEQRKCRFEPRLIIVSPNSPVTLRNTDAIAHNFRAIGHANPEMSKILPPGSTGVTVSFAQPEAIEVSCTIHPWFTGRIVVAEHPYYAVTDEKGAYRLIDVPAGDYTLVLWHERLGTKTRRIRVREGEETRIDFKLSEGD